MGLWLALSLAPGQGAQAGESVLQCVPFARALSSISLYGDAWRWWTAAAGRYERGHVPRAGSVLSFRPDPRMPLGHVAVVTRVVSAREIEVDQANWAFPGTITRSVPVLDVSPGNDWTAVRVGLLWRDHFGSVYATDGFIYGRPIEPHPQIIDVAQALRAIQEHNTGLLPVVIEGGAIQPADADRQAPALPVVIYTHGERREVSQISRHRPPRPEAGGMRQHTANHRSQKLTYNGRRGDDPLTKMAASLHMAIGVPLHADGKDAARGG